LARIRSLKPGFFTNEHLAELPFAVRLLFAGLWTLADREGRLEDRPRRIKAALFPYDDVNVNDMLQALAEKGFVIRYTADGADFLSIPTFLQHQRPKTDEYPSSIPAPLLEHPRGKVSGPRIDIREQTLGLRQRTEGCADGALLFADGADNQEAADGAGAQRRAEDFMDLWNSSTQVPIPRCRELTSKRRRHIKARLTESPLDTWRAIFERIQASAFCRGENDRGWRASFDWVIGSPDVAVKVLEGKYDDRTKPRKPTTEPWTCPHTPKCPHEPACWAVSQRKVSA
jgi:hypothetical protein